MKGIINYKEDEDYMSIDLAPQEFIQFSDFLQDSGINFQKKSEFHVTLSSIRGVDAIVEGGLTRGYVRSILKGYMGEEISDISIGRDIHHITKGEKHSLITEIYSAQTLQILEDVSQKIKGFVSPEDAFLHTTLYTTLEHPRGTSLGSKKDFKEFSSGIVARDLCI